MFIFKRKCKKRGILKYVTAVYIHWFLLLINMYCTTVLLIAILGPGIFWNGKVYYQLPASQPALLPASYQKVWEGRVWCDVARELLLGMPLRKLVSTRKIFSHQLALVRAVILWWKQWPGTGWNEKIALSQEKWCCWYHHHHSYNSVFCLCHIFYNIIFCHKTSLWWGQTLHLTICATLALYFFFSSNCLKLEQLR